MAETDRVWTEWDWEREPDAPREWGPERRVVLVRDLLAALPRKIA